MRATLLIAWLALALGAAEAHDLLLDPSHGHQDARAVVSMKLLLGHADERRELTPDARAATYVCVTPDGKRHVPGARDAGLGLFDATQSGVYVFGYATRPALLHVAPADLREVAREAGVERTVGRELERSTLVRPWRVEERHHAKSVVVIGAGEDGRPDVALGLELELIPGIRPDRMVPKKAIDVRVLESGRPLTGARVVAFPREAPTREIVVPTDAAGRASLVLPGSGGWAVRVVRLRRAPRTSAAEWIVSRASLTFEIPESPPAESPRRSAER